MATAGRDQVAGTVSQFFDAARVRDAYRNVKCITNIMQLIVQNGD